MKREFTLSVNGAARKVSCDEDELLLDTLRERLSLTGAKRGCGIGACGACTVLVDGRPVRSCRVTMASILNPEARDSEKHAPSRVPSPESRIPIITTIEGLEVDGKLHPIQQAFIDCGAVQCGFCTPGMVLAAKALLDANHRPSRDEIKRALAANLCRCTGYRQIFEAVETAAEALYGRAPSRKRGVI